MKHYFTEESSAGPLHPVSIRYKTRTLPWNVAGGVFATRGLDEGTKLLLDCLRVAPGQLLLDAGCGTGAIGLLPHLDCSELASVLCDVNPAALACAAANARLHHVTGARLVRCWATTALLPGRFDVAASNPPIRAGRKVVEEILQGSINSLKPGGVFYMVVRVQQGGWTLAERLGEWAKSTPRLLLRSKGYLVFSLTKPDLEGGAARG